MSAESPAVTTGHSASAAEPLYLAGPPLFWRLLAANMIVVLGGAVVGTALTRQFVLHGAFTPLTHSLMVLAAIALSGLLTAAILHLAFRPLRVLRAAIDDARAAGRPLASPARRPERYGDPDIMAVAQAVHGLWDRLDQQVRLLEESNRRLEEQRAELAEKTVQLERLAGLVLAAQEDERRRIARELHDDTMQSIAALIMGLERGLQAMPPDVPHLRAAHQTVAHLRDLAVRTLEDLRHLALDLRPAVLDDHGLVAALRWLVETQTERYGLQVRLEVRGAFGDDGPDGRLQPAAETALFRIAQEALANAARHAQAQHVVVRLGRDAVAVCAEIEDDGVGLPETPDGPAVHGSPPGHMGLFNIRERAALLGGRCTFQPGANGRGTLVHVALPLAAGGPVAVGDRRPMTDDRPRPPATTGDRAEIDRTPPRPREVERKAASSAVGHDAIAAAPHASASAEAARA